MKVERSQCKHGFCYAWEYKCPESVNPDGSGDYCDECEKEFAAEDLKNIEKLLGGMFQ